MTAAHRPPVAATTPRRRGRFPKVTAPWRFLPWTLGAILVTSQPTSGQAAELPVPDFSRDILPVLSDACFACHGPDERARKGGLRLDTRDGAFGTGQSGARAIVPAASASSEVIRRLRTQDPEDRMPPDSAKKPLSPAQISLLTRWVDSGAAWGRHWAYEPPVRPAVPPDPFATPHATHATHPIDAFVRERLSREGLRPAPEAPPETLVRRVTLDLTGIPPKPEEIDAYLADALPGAWERLVDRLLASPRYGERMAWEWLEAARYADSNGYQGDAERTMWPWRDWVVRSLNDNLRFDTFTLWQLAGDLLPDAGLEQRLATAFVRNHMINGEGGRIPEENRIDYLFDQTETIGTVWLAATLNCCRCHDHKFDPLSQKDYYGFLAHFDRTAVDGSGGDPQSRPNLEIPSPEQSERRRVAEQALEEAARATDAFELRKFPRDAGKSASESEAARDLPKELRETLATPAKARDAGRLEKLAGHWQPLDPAYGALLDRQRKTWIERDAAQRAIPRVMIMQDVPTPRDTFVLQRGLYTQPGAKSAPGLPAALFVPPAASPPTPDRLGLARWLLDPAHPLTARVVVNRAWQTFFGTGLVKTAEDFGLQGEKPSHPALLDWLATEFVASGWNVKHLHRLLVTSQTYRQTSAVDALVRDKDPENRLLARGPRFRMPSWMIRDAALAVAGLLAERPGGPPVRPYQPAGVWEEATFGNKRYVQDHGSDLYRRSLYVFWRRIVAPTLFFDVANRQTCTVRTPRTNVPLHALLTLNDDTYVEAARALAERLLRLPQATTESRLALAGRLVLARPLRPQEYRILADGLDRHRLHFEARPEAARRWLAHGESARDPNLDPTEHAAWTAICSTLLNLDEALTRE